MTDGLLKGSFFSNALDAVPKPWEGPWVELVEILSRDHPPSNFPGIAEPKKALPALSGASYPNGLRRGKGHVDRIQLFIVDFDNAGERATGAFHLDREGIPSGRPILEKVCLDTPAQPEEILAVLEARWKAGYLYTTWSHTLAWPRFRCVVPLAISIHPGHWATATEWLIDHLGLRPYVEGIDLPALKDPARIYFLPSVPPGGRVDRWRAEGEPVSVPLDELLCSSASARGDSHNPTAFSAARPLDITWQKGLRSGSGWADLRELDLVALMRDMGIRVGLPRPYGDGTKWRTTCPWFAEHSHGVDDDCGVIIQNPGHWPIWKCAHAHHSHLGLLDLLAAFRGGR